MRTATKKQFVKRCEELGVEYINNGYCLAIDAPQGKVFSANDSHSEVIIFNPSWKMREIYGEFMLTMEDGIEDCTNPHCIICSNL